MGAAAAAGAATTAEKLVENCELEVEEGVARREKVKRDVEAAKLIAHQAGQVCGGSVTLPMTCACFPRVPCRPTYT